jgi:hypothetical protein
MLQPTKAFFEEALGVTKQVSTAMVTAWGLLGNFFVLWFSKGGVALDTIDFWVGSFFILVVAAVQIIAFGWVFGLERGIDEAHSGAQLRIPRFFHFVIKYVSPVYLLVVIIGFSFTYLPDKTIAEGYVSKVMKDADTQRTWLFLLLTIAALLAITVVGSRRWRAQGRDLDGRLPATD